MLVIRTLLFAPGNNARRVEKALNSNADAAIIDLEDSVPNAEKEATRPLVRQALSQGRRNLAYVRVNGLTTPWAFGDLKAVVCPQLDGIVLAKAESGEAVRLVDWLVGALEREAGMTRGRIDLIPLVETARGLANAEEIAAACPRVKHLAFGAGDYTTDLGINLSKEGTEIFYARSRLAAVSCAAGIDPPIDTVFLDIRDTEALTADACMARRLGFQGKLVIHPDQVAPVNEAFTPGTEEVAQAQEIVNAFEQAEAQGVGAIQVGGRLVDYPIARHARRILALAEVAAKVAGGGPGHD